MVGDSEPDELKLRLSDRVTEWESLEKARKKEVFDAMKNMSEASKSTWNYVNLYYDQSLK